MASWNGWRVTSSHSLPPFKLLCYEFVRWHTFARVLWFRINWMIAKLVFICLFMSKVPVGTSWDPLSFIAYHACMLEPHVIISGSEEFIFLEMIWASKTARIELPEKKIEKKLSGTLSPTVIDCVPLRCVMLYYVLRQSTHYFCRAGLQFFTQLCNR